MSDPSETAHAKINLALHVRERLPDGYHRIETLFAFCDDGDELSAERAESTELIVSGEFASGLSASDNLVIRAAQALRKTSGANDGAVLHLQKRLPIAAGIGGGSADAGAALRLLNGLWGLYLPPDRLEEVARPLGADVPACIRSETARGTGKGDILQTTELGLSGTPLLLVNPRVKVATADVYSRWDGVDRGPLGDWNEGRNDLQDAAISIAPLIGGVLAWLSAQRGASFVRMSGSGGTCFALFEDDAARDAAATAVPREWWRLATRLR